MGLSILIVTALITVNAYSSNISIEVQSPVIEVVNQQTVRFRSTQKLSSRDGREIYFYSSGKCEGFYNDRLEFSCKYTIIDRDIRLLDEDGNTVYKGTCTYKSDHQNLLNVTIAGTTYFAK